MSWMLIKKEKIIGRLSRQDFLVLLFFPFGFLYRTIFIARMLASSDLLDVSNCYFCVVSLLQFYAPV